MSAIEIVRASPGTVAFAVGPILGYSICINSQPQLLEKKREYFVRHEHRNLHTFFFLRIRLLLENGLHIIRGLPDAPTPIQTKLISVTSPIDKAGTSPEP